MKLKTKQSLLSRWLRDFAQKEDRSLDKRRWSIALRQQIAGAPITSVQSASVGGGVAVKEDKSSILLTFGEGSIWVVNYFANGSKSYPKERLEVFSEGRTLVIDNFRKTTGWGFAGFKELKTQRQDKGHRVEVGAFCQALAAGEGAPIRREDLESAARVSIRAICVQPGTLGCVQP